MKSVYKSKYIDPDKLITVAQHLAELMCERMASREKIDLPFKFFNLPKWKKTFLYQVTVANGLLKIYSEEAIKNVIRMHANMYSLSAPMLDSLIQAEQEKLNRRAQVTIPQEVDAPTDISSKPRESFVSKKSIINKLRDL